MQGSLTTLNFGEYLDTSTTAHGQQRTGQQVLGGDLYDEHLGGGDFSGVQGMGYEAMGYDEDAALQLALSLSVREAAETASGQQPLPSQVDAGGLRSRDMRSGDMRSRDAESTDAYLTAIEERLASQRLQWQKEQDELSNPIEGQRLQWQREQDDEEELAIAIRRSLEDGVVSDGARPCGALSHPTPSQHPPPAPSWLHPPEYEEDERGWVGGEAVGEVVGGVDGGCARGSCPLGSRPIGHHIGEPGGISVPPGLSPMLPMSPTAHHGEGVLRTWALLQLEALLADDSAMEPSVLLEYVLSIECDSELVDYVDAFVGGERAQAFALELCARRRRD